MTHNEFLDLEKELEKYIGTLCLTDYGELVLYKGMYVSEIDDEWTYDLESSKEQFGHSTCMGLIFLWQELTPDSYNILVRNWNLNNTTQARYNRIVNVNLIDLFCNSFDN